MTEERFLEIMKTTNSCLYNYTDDNAILGLNIIRKYCPQMGITGADYDIIYSVGVVDLVTVNIVEEDVVELAKLNWIVEEDVLACFI